MKWILLILILGGNLFAHEECPDPEFKVIQNDTDGIILQYITSAEYHSSDHGMGWWSGGDKALKHFSTYGEFEIFLTARFRDKYDVRERDKKTLEDSVKDFQEQLDKHRKETKEKLEELSKELKGKI